MKNTTKYEYHRIIHQLVRGQVLKVIIKDLWDEGYGWSLWMTKGRLYSSLSRGPVDDPARYLRDLIEDSALRYELTFEEIPLDY